MSKIAVFNTETLGASEYSLPWTDIVFFNGYLYGLSSSGMEKLAGPIEEDASPSLKTGKMNLRAGAECAVHPMHMLVSSNEPLTLTVVGDAAGEEETITFSVPVQVSSKPRQRRIPLARGAKASAWSFELASTGAIAANWSISNMSVETPAVRYPRN